jgi:hypothetical protein
MFIYIYNLSLSPLHNLEMKCANPLGRDFAGAFYVRILVVVSYFTRSYRKVSFKQEYKIYLIENTNCTSALLARAD